MTTALKTALKATLDRLRAELDRLGPPGVAGIALIAFAAAFYASAVIPLEVELSRLHAEADALQERLHMNGSPAGGPTRAADQLATFYTFFPAAQTSPEWIGKIFAAARAKGLVLQSGEYKLERRADQKLARYQITLPVSGSYAQIRGFVGEVLAQVPAAALEEISLRREGVASPTIEARLRLTLFLQGL